MSQLQKTVAKNEVLVEKVQQFQQPQLEVHVTLHLNSLHLSSLIYDSEIIIAITSLAYYKG